MAPGKDKGQRAGATNPRRKSVTGRISVTILVSGFVLL
jgi:hypothetical protein